MLIKFIILFVTSTCLTIFIMPLVRKIAVKYRIVDIPGPRKVHKGTIPRMGGMGIAISFYTNIALGYLLFRSKLSESLVHLIGLCIGGALIFLLGLIDDAKGLNAPKKFAGQIAAALIILPFGFPIQTITIPFIGTTNLGYVWGALLTISWIVVITNGFNLIDGMDGLAGGVTLIASIMLFVMSLMSHRFLMSFVSIVLAGSTLGFLRYNFHPATIFMGDCGALFIGFILASVSIESGFKSITTVLVLGLPIIDTSAAIVRRILKRKPLFSADKEHIHHKLLIGLTVRKAAFVLYGVCLLLGIAALVTTVAQSSIAAGIMILIPFAAFAGIRVLNKLLKARAKNAPSVSKELEQS